MADWFHELKGKYSIPDRYVGIDFARLFLKPIDADATLVHEVVHGAIAMNDFGQATSNFVKIEKQITTIPRNEKDKIVRSLVGLQEFTQEGLATFLQVCRVKELTNLQTALDWASKTLPEEYLARFKKFEFLFDLTRKQIDFFTGRTAILAMENGFRKEAVQKQLFQSHESVLSYLEKEQNAPDYRIAKIMETVRFKPWLLTKPIDVLANECGIKFYEAATKQEVADYLNYLLSLTQIQRRKFEVSDIGDTPVGLEALMPLAQNVIVGNMNLNLTETAEALFDINDLIHYSDVIEVVFILPDYIGPHYDFNIMAMRATGEKYLFKASLEQAKLLTRDTFAKSTVIIKEGGFVIPQNQMFHSAELRHADIVIYNNLANLRKTILTFMETNPEVKIEHFHMASAPNHPLGTLLIRIPGQEPWHIVNVFGDKALVDFISELGSRTTRITRENIIQHQTHLNNLFFAWMGLPWKVDWIGTMLDGTKIQLR